MMCLKIDKTGRKYCNLFMITPTKYYTDLTGRWYFVRYECSSLHRGYPIPVYKKIITLRGQK